MNKLNLLYIGPVFSQSGYGAHSRDIVRALIKSDKYNVTIISTLWGMTPNSALFEKNENDKIIIDRLLKSNLTTQPDVLVQMGLPTEFNPIAKYNIGITAGSETNMCSPQFIEGLNKMQLILVPSNFTKQVFELSSYNKINKYTNQSEGVLKCEVPIEVLFEGADTEIYKKVDEIHREIFDEINKIPEIFLFLFVGHWLPGTIGHDRKDLGMLIKTFFQTFKNNPSPPALLLKTSRGNFSASDREDIINKIQDIRNFFNKKDNLPNVYILHGELNDAEINSLYNHPKVKVHISFTHGESFCRPLLEASLSGKPVIAPNWSGQIDFLKPELSTLLPGKLINIDKSVVWEPILIENSKWFQVDYNYASQILKDVKRNYKLYLEKASKQRKYSKDNFNINIMQNNIIKIFDKYISNIPKEINLQLPQLEKIEPSIIK